MYSASLGFNGPATWGKLKKVMENLGVSDDYPIYLSEVGAKSTDDKPCITVIKVQGDVKRHWYAVLLKEKV